MDMGGAPPHTDTLIRPAACGRVQIGLFKTKRQCAKLSLVLLDSLASPSDQASSRLCKAVTSRNQQQTAPCSNTAFPVTSGSSFQRYHVFPNRATGETRTNPRGIRSRGSQSNTWKPTWETRPRSSLLNQLKASIHNRISISD